MLVDTAAVAGRLARDRRPGSGRASVRTVVAIPVCNEEERIAPCLHALAGQAGAGSAAFGAVLFVNNTGDRTMEIVQALIPSLPFAVRLVRDEARRPPNAGWARRRAMELAAEWLEEAAPGDALAAILTTDADTVVPTDWVARNLAALQAGADAVAGSLRLDPDDEARLPAALRARGALEGAYESLLLELASRLRPQAHDPWPRHGTTSGASLAVTLASYRSIGGMPALPVGEDRAFAAALADAGARLRHDPGIQVVTSGRLVGRAVGGAADTMRMRAIDLDAPCDDRMEPLARSLVRALCPAVPLARRPLRPTELPRQIAMARPLVGLLRLRDGFRSRAARRGGTRPSGPSGPYPKRPALSP